MIGFVQGFRCKGINDGCCTEEQPCGKGDGDCDKDSECAAGLVCGSNNCPWGDDDDCCMAPEGGKKHCVVSAT